MPASAGPGATDRRAELATRFAVVLRKAWAQTFLMSVWRACRQQGRSATHFLSQVLPGTPAVLAAPP